MPTNRTLEQVCLDVLAGEQCSADNFRQAVAEANSAVLIDRIRANAIVTACGDPVQRETSSKELERLARDETNLTNVEQFLLLTAFLQLRCQTVRMAIPRQFVFQTARSTEEELRCNATILLADLAKTDTTALDLLRELALDPAESVRTNAATFLRMLA
jgi:hypothetical protein